MFNFYLLSTFQEECGWIGFASTLFSAAGGMTLGYISDKRPGHIRHLLLVLFAFAVTMFAWVAMICLHYFPYNLGQLLKKYSYTNLVVVF